MNYILHLSYDVRDRLNKEKTKAVEKLINETAKFSKPVVVSLVRVPNFNEEKVETVNSDYLNINSMGLPYGILLIEHLKRAYKAIMNAERTGLLNLKKIKAVHAHKLSYEGYIANMIAQKYKVPLLITLRQTDFTVLKYRPDLINIYKDILKNSFKVFYLIPSMVGMLKSRVGDSFFNEHISSKLIYLPNITERDFKNQAESNGTGPFLTIFRMTKDSVKRKNIKNLFKAFAEINDPNIKLNVIGDGDYSQTVKSWAYKLGLLNKISFLGAISNSEIDKYYAASKAFLMPSYSESFGMVYSEALINGTPIMFSKGVLGFEGVFENVGCGVNPHSVKSIKNGILDLIENNESYRNTIKELKNRNAFHIFNADYIRETYKNVLNELFEGKNKCEEISSEKSKVPFFVNL